MGDSTKKYHHGHLAEAVLERAAQIIDERGIEALTLRGIARDLGVSHGAPNRHFKNKAALLAALATDAWSKILAATLEAADVTGSDDPHVRLNAMGRGYMRWAFKNRSLFRALLHPDVNRYATPELSQAIEEFSKTVRDAVQATQKAGRHTNVPLSVLNIYTNSVPAGAAMLMIDSLMNSQFETDAQFEDIITQVINLVVPLPEDDTLQSRKPV